MRAWWWELWGVVRDARDIAGGWADLFLDIVFTKTFLCGAAGAATFWVAVILVAECVG